ncbi:hypothetical protein [Chitinophaga ginsengisoli]|uniref:Uncharacterized protein n=1 Tax=Chitinophaga ginsengisoli TaxID=363837 RepID=A0A2P8FXJ8_9BACT|nr:hypothetical protein [Chitinophaga ginsengisoli]PSL26442.1 hypothetical protein CLV42_111156 [Chitinophaga ginsengisoli]
MKKVKESALNACSFLQSVHCVFYAIPNKFRDEITKECGISIPTYYRRVRHDGPKCSNAEKDKIAQIAIEKLKAAISECEVLISKRKQLN